MFEEVIERLKQRINQPLPGVDAQRRMAPMNTDPRRYYNGNGDAKLGSVLVLLYPKNGEICFPLMQRPQYNGHHSGQISLPGGKKEEVDNGLQATAVREANEEIGVLPEQVNIIGNLSELYVMASNFRVLPVLAYANAEPDFIADPHEVDEIIESSLGELLNPANRKCKNIHIRDNMKIHSPYFDIQGRVVWGATAMMLSELRCLLRDVLD